MSIVHGVKAYLEMSPRISKQEIFDKHYALLSAHCLEHVQSPHQMRRVFHTRKALDDNRGGHIRLFVCGKLFLSRELNLEFGIIKSNHFAVINRTTLLCSGSLNRSKSIGIIYWSSLTLLPSLSTVSLSIIQLSIGHFFVY